MSLFLKRLVSGNKARFRDDDLNLELDLVYVTDRIIVMGFPAVGVESIYRNHRADVQRFLSARHGSDFWGRISRYPFPDHHVPPLLYLPLVSREIHSWLSGSDARVAVLHCKAGKGRSGTLACAYLLSLYASPAARMPTAPHDSITEWSLIGDREGLQTPLENTSIMLPATADRLPLRPTSVTSGADLSRVSSEPSANTLEKVLDLHTSRRMKPLRNSRYRKPKMGVSIPSQRRWLSYWSQILTGKGPLSLRPSVETISSGDQRALLNDIPQTSKIKLTKLTVRMREPSRVQPHLVQAASAVIVSTGKGRADSDLTTGRLWASLARYDDHLVDELEHRENESHSSGGKMSTSPFTNDRWDKSKMIRSVARLGTTETPAAHEGERKRSVLTYVLRPLDEAEADWVKLRQPVPELECENGKQDQEDGAEEGSPGIQLEANRELRIKLFMGEVTLGWVWLIPAFHMTPDSRSSSLVLANDDIDFAIGVGKGVVDMKISLAWDACKEGP